MFRAALFQIPLQPALPSLTFFPFTQTFAVLCHSLQIIFLVLYSMRIRQRALSSSSSSSFSFIFALGFGFGIQHAERADRLCAAYVGLKS